MPSATKAIHYVEPETEPLQVRSPRKKAKKKQNLLGAGVTKRKVILVMVVVAISLFSIMLINPRESEPDNPGVDAVFPISLETIEQQMNVVQLINKERKDQGLNPLDYSNNSLPQRYAEEMLGSGLFKHNPDLPGTMGENIDLFALGPDYNVTDVLETLIHEQVHDDSENGQGNRDNILYENNTKVCVGVAYDDARVIYI